MYKSNDDAFLTEADKNHGELEPKDLDAAKTVKTILDNPHQDEDILNEYPSENCDFDAGPDGLGVGSKQ